MLSQRTRAKAGILLALAAGAIGLMFTREFCSKEELVEYVSSPIDVNGVKYRAKGLIPAGWDYMKPFPYGGVMIGPRGMRWLPEWIRKRFEPDVKSSDEVILAFNIDVEAPRSTQVCQIRGTSRNDGWNSTACRLLIDAPCTILYSNSDRSQFDRTYRAVCDGFHVEKVGN